MKKRFARTAQITSQNTIRFPEEILLHLGALVYDELEFWIDTDEKDCIIIKKVKSDRMKLSDRLKKSDAPKNGEKTEE